MRSALALGLTALVLVGLMGCGSDKKADPNDPSQEQIEHAFNQWELLETATQLYHCRRDAPLDMDEVIERQLAVLPQPVSIEDRQMAMAQYAVEFNWCLHHAGEW